MSEKEYALRILDEIRNRDGIGYNDYSDLWDAISDIPVERNYTEAEYIMALHKEYGCDFVRAKKAHDKALTYLRDTSMLKG